MMTQLITGEKIMNNKTIINVALQKHFKRSLMILSLMATVPFLANAQEVEQKVEEKVVGIEIIEVTARKRVESIQSTPIAISAFTKTAMKNRGMQSSADVGNFTPNVQFDTSSSFAGASTFQGYIRGIGQSDFAINTDPGVGVYVDGVYYARTVGSVIDLMDVERIEVLKGPQGTLFGRNTIGGALNIITTAPNDEFDFNGEVTLGDFNRKDASAFINIPLTDDLYTSFAISMRNRDGYQERITLDGVSNENLGLPLDQILTADQNNGREQGAVNNQTLRAKALWNISDNVEATFTFDYASVRDTATATTLLDVGGIEGGLNELFNGCVLGLAPAEICNTSAFIANETLLFDNQFLTGDIDKTYASGANYSNIDSGGLSAIFNWDISENLTVTSISAFRTLDGAFGVDLDGTPLAYDQTTFTMDTEQWSQEFQLNGDIGIFTYTGGVYFYNEDATQQDFVPIAGGLIQVAGGNSQETDAVAVFGETNINVTNDFSITLGVRYTEEEKVVLLDQKSLNPEFFIATGFPEAGFPRDDLTYLGPEEPQKLKFDNTSVRAGLNWQINKDLFTYVSFSQGFKSGGITTRLTAPFNPEIAIGGLTNLTFNEETVDSYEVGFKGSFYDNHVRFNVALFQNNFDDIQIVVQRGVTPANENAGAAKITGIEVDFEALLTENLNINFALGLLDAKYTELNDLVGLDPNNIELPNTPEMTASVALNWYPTDSIGFNVNYSYTSEVYNDFENTALLKADASAIVGASIIYTSPEEKWSITGGVTNLTDERRLISGFNAGALNFVVGSYNRPRELYLTLGYNF
jgi:iron complex outermembrane receptor protein